MNSPVNPRTLAHETATDILAEIADRTLTVWQKPQFSDTTHGIVARHVEMAIAKALGI